MYSTTKILITTEDDILLVLGFVRKAMQELCFTELDQQKVLVSVSELTRNVLNHTDQRGTFEYVEFKDGIQITISDNGPGIKDLDAALNGVKSHKSKGLGIGLSAVQRLMDEVEIITSERGTKIIATKKI